MTPKHWGMGPEQLNLKFDKEKKMLDPSQYGWQSWQVQVSWKKISSRIAPTPNADKVPGKSLYQAVYRAAGQDSILALKWKTDAKMKYSQDYLKSL